MVQHDHTPDWDNSKVLKKETAWDRRTIREAIAIRKQKKTMNRDDGAYRLSHIFDQLLLPGRPGGPGINPDRNRADDRGRHTRDVPLNI